jgi:ABC-2 family transporter
LRARELARKDVAELFAGRAFWLLLLFIGLLTGQSFISAVDAYAEASGIGGGPAALAQGLSPLDGFLVPTMGAYDLAIMLLFPFVAIRLIASEKSSGAWKLMSQWPVTMRDHLLSKLGSLLIAWLIALIPFAIAIALWLLYGGHLDACETLNLLLGYTLRYVLTASVAVAAAALMPGAANAAVVVLGLTIGTWALDFLATGRGGVVERLASFTPAATLRMFERGLLRIDLILILLLLSLLAFAIASIALDLGAQLRKRITRSAIAIVLIAVAIAIAAQVRTSFDVSENRRNSFASADEQMLASIREPLTITVFLAAEDPRMNDYENNVLMKLRRTMPKLRVRYPFAGSSALFENDARYGEIHYALGGRTAVERSSTEEIVIETIATLARKPIPTHGVAEYPGYPLAQHPRGAAWIFYALWPLVVITAWRLRSRRTG